MKTLTWQQVNAWRLSQQHLSPRLKHREFVKAAARTCGIQAQIMSAAEMALGARTDGLTPDDVQSALWQDHTLVKTWAMRGTLHLVAAGDLPLIVAARSDLDSRDWLGYFAYYGLTPAQYEAYLDAVPEVLSKDPMTREQFAVAVSLRARVPELQKLLLDSSWGSPLKPSAFRGDLCFGPNQGRNVTFVNPRKFTSKWPSIEPREALKEIIRRYLQAYGPATPGDFALWWWGGGGVGHAKKLFKTMSDEIEEVEVEGWRGWALSNTIEPIQHHEPTHSINLLPLFDAYVLGTGRDVEAILPGAHKSKVFRPQGWVTAVVLVDGYIKGVWEYKTTRSLTTLKVSMFSPTTATIKKGVEVEAERLGTFLGTKVQVEYT